MAFLGRHLMYFARHLATENEVVVLEHTAFQFLKFMAYKAPYLKYKPSHQSAAACVLAVNLFASNACVVIGLARVPIENLQLLKFMSDGELGM